MGDKAPAHVLADHFIVRPDVEAEGMVFRCRGMGYNPVGRVVIPECRRLARRRNKLRLSVHHGERHRLGDSGAVLIIEIDGERVGTLIDVCVAGIG